MLNFKSRSVRRGTVFGVPAALAIGAALWIRPAARDAVSVGRGAVSSHAVSKAEPPWLYGRADARYTVVEYADLECPYCKAYFPTLRQWIDGHAEVNWEWHHLPLSMHEPAASVEARLVECVGRAQGPSAFWKALGWVYGHTGGDGQGLPAGLRYPDLTPALQGCLDGEQAGEAVRAQAAAAARDGFDATPTLRLEDHATGKSLVLHGPVEGDALLSAIDLVTASGTALPAPGASSAAIDSGSR